MNYDYKYKLAAFISVLASVWSVLEPMYYFNWMKC